MGEHLILGGIITLALTAVELAKLALSKIGSPNSPSTNGARYELERERNDAIRRSLQEVVIEVRGLREDMQLGLSALRAGHDRATQDILSEVRARKVVG